MSGCTAVMERDRSLGAKYTSSVCVCVDSSKAREEKQGIGEVIMKVLSGSFPYSKQDQSNFEVGKRKVPKSTAPVIYKHNRDRELLAGANAEGRSKATSDLSVHVQKQTHTPTPPALIRNTLIQAETSTHARTPLKTRSFSDTNVCLHNHAHANNRGQTSGVCCQDIVKTKSQPPLGMTGFDQSKALFQVSITFQLLKLMNSLYCLMKSSVANEVDSVFVLFTAHSKNNIVTALPCKVKQRKMISQSISCPATRTSTSRIIHVPVFLDHLIPLFVYHLWEASEVEVHLSPA